MTTGRRQSGVGLIEAVIATAIVVTALSILAGLASVALRTVMAARDRSLAVMHAHSKFEQIRSSPLVPAESPPDGLDRDVQGWSEYLDSAGRVNGIDPGATGRVFVRRWRITELGARSDLHTIAVRVGRCVAPGPSTGCTMPGDAVVVAGVRSEAAW